MNGIRVVLLEDLGGQEKEVEEHGVGDQLGDLEKGRVLDLDVGDPPDYLEDDDHHGRARAEGARQEPGRQDRRVPEGPRRQSVIEEGGHRVDAHGPGDGDQDEGNDELPVRFLSDNRASPACRRERVC